MNALHYKLIWYMLYLLSKIKKKLWRYLHVAQKDRGLKIKVFDDQLSSIA